jgi:signal transduction histidine kinase
MLNRDNNLTINSDRQIPEFRTQQYHQIITDLSIRQSTFIPIFVEATTQAARLTESPVAILTLIAESGFQIAAIFGLELLTNLGKDANLSIELAGIEYCHAQTITSNYPQNERCQRSFVIDDFRSHPELSTTSLFRVHDIQAYIGVPIITAAGDRLGVISVLDFAPHQFSDADGEPLQARLRERNIDLLHLVSRWLASEFERKLLSQSQLNYWIGDLQNPHKHGFDDPEAATEHIEIEPIYPTKKSSSKRDLHRTYPQVKGEIQFKLLTHLAQELRTPLTSVLGMSSVLQQEIYGPLTSKQKDYLAIVYNSGQQLVSIVDEIGQLGAFLRESSSLPSREQHQLDLKSVDLEMLCQLAIKPLEPIANQKHQQILLNLTQGNRLWLLDKDKVRQIIYYLSLSLIQASGTHHRISIFVANLTDRLQIQITTNDPHPKLLDLYNSKVAGGKGKSASILQPPTGNENAQDLRISLGLALSHSLAALHHSQVELLPNGSGYQFSLPLTILK